MPGRLSVTVTLLPGAIEPVSRAGEVAVAVWADEDEDEDAAEEDADEEDPEEPHPARIATARSVAVRENALVMTSSTAPAPIAAAWRASTWTIEPAAASSATFRSDGLAPLYAPTPVFSST